MPFLCLDLGGSKSTGALYAADGTVLVRATGPAGALSLGTDATLAAVQAIWSGMGQAAEIAALTDVHIGLAGIGLRDWVAQVRANLTQFHSVRCVSDGFGALLDATGGQPGVLIVIGTGVVAMRLNPDGTFLTASGWGFPAGDLCGGAWIGMQATAGLTRFLDGVTPAPAARLADQMMQITGRTASAIMVWLTSGRAGDYAQLAPIVAGSDDPFARHIMTAAGTEIAAIADALHNGTPGVVRVAGGLGPALLSFCVHAAPRHDWQSMDADPLRGLFLMASGQAPDERLVPRPGLGLADYRDR